MGYYSSLYPSPAVVTNSQQSQQANVGDYSTAPGSPVTAAQPANSSSGGPALALLVVVLILVGIRLAIDFNVKAGD